MDLPSIDEIMRLPSPAPAPQALAFDGELLWMGSWETQRIYGIVPQRGTVREEANAPGRPVGAVAVGDELRVVCSEGVEDNRFIRRYIPGHGFKMNEKVPCPDDTGSFLAFDGLHLWLSQRYDKRILELDAAYAVTRVIPFDAQIVGIVLVGQTLYLSTWHGRDGGCKIARGSLATGTFEYVASAGFAAISITHDGSRFWSNDPRTNEMVAYTLP
ncbi:MAG TPA: hypothetical protein VMH02_01015 [Verrucomicrobiae bacterium]|nr:hypothetical protein [Verrucomicrobiae bacterium]